MIHNLRKVQKEWLQLSRVLEKEREDYWASVLFYIVVVQVVLLYEL